MKIQKSLLLFFLSCSLFAVAQNSKLYRSEKDKIHNLVHTKLKVDFNFAEKQLNGEAWITAKPHFYKTDKIVLDAKAMIIQEVAMNNRKLDYYYDDLEISIDLPKEYKKDEVFTLYIKYIARPEKVKENSAIKSSKGLYFINADGIDKNKPTQIWTQGETEANSCWFPTIDSPNQKTSQEIYITVPDKYKTLSNGKLMSQIQKGTNRTDYWKFDKKHAPYLFFYGNW
jgi:aminopeptidase N